MKNELIKSLRELEVVKNKELNGRALSVTNHEQAIPIVKDYELVIGFQMKGMLHVAYRQGLLLKKFNDSNKFEQILMDIEVSKSTVYFKVKLVNLLDKHPKIKCLSLSLSFLKDYAKAINEVCKGNRGQFN